MLSRWEGFGLAIPEYMLCEKPIVATRVDAIPYLIKDGYNGLLVDVENYAEASKKVVSLKDTELKNRLVANGLKVLKQKFDAKRMVRELSELLEEI